MSNTNSPDSGDTAWQEYLTGGEQPEVRCRGTSAAHTGTEQPEEPAGPRRVIGTPPPATARTMLPRPGRRRRRPPGPRTAADPDNPAPAKKAELVVAACFILAMLSGFGFLVAYGLSASARSPAALHSNLAARPHAVPDAAAARRGRHDLGPAADARRSS